VPAGPSPYHIKGDYKITDSMTLLGEFELLFTHDTVRTVYAFQVEGSAPLPATGGMAATGAGGVCLKPVMAKVITSPTSYRQQKAEAAEDSCEDLGVKQHAESDIDEGDPVVDTDAESVAESGNTTGSASDSSTGSEEAPKKAPPNKVPATGGTMPATGGSPDKPATHGKSGLGRFPQTSNAISPWTVGETREKPRCSLFEHTQGGLRATRLVNASSQRKPMCCFMR